MNLGKTAGHVKLQIKITTGGVGLHGPNVECYSASPKHRFQLIQKASDLGTLVGNEIIGESGAASGRDRVTVLLDILGRDARTTVDTASIEPA